MQPYTEKLSELKAHDRLNLSLRILHIAQGHIWTAHASWYRDEHASKIHQAEQRPEISELMSCLPASFFRPERVLPPVLQEFENCKNPCLRLRVRVSRRTTNRNTRRKFLIQDTIGDFRFLSLNFWIDLTGRTLFLCSSYLHEPIKVGQRRIKLKRRSG